MENGAFRMIPGCFWGYAYVRPRTEKRVKASLDAKGITGYLPLMPKARMHHSTKVVSYLPMIPGYVFLCTSDEERRSLKTEEKHIVQIELLRESALEEKFLAELNILKKCEELANNEPVLINPDISGGDDVVVTSGPLAGLEAQVVRRADDANVIVVNLPLLNFHVEYRVSAEMLKKITK